ncbi:hypothetical protein ACA910_013555 [Epithemia clementina (nom. ined.)]
MMTRKITVWLLASRFIASFKNLRAVDAFVQLPQIRNAAVNPILTTTTTTTTQGNRHRPDADEVLPHRSIQQRGGGGGGVNRRTCGGGTARFAALENLSSVAAAGGGAVSEAGSKSLSPLMVFFLETLITNGVPAFFTIVVFGFIAVIIGKTRKSMKEDDALKTDNPVAALYEDLYGDQEQDRASSFFGGAGGRDRGGFGRTKLPRNSGIPKLKYLKVTHLNRQYDSYDYSLTLATQSKASAAAAYRKISFSRALEKALPLSTINALPASTLRAMQEAEKAFLKKGQTLVSKLQRRQTILTKIVIDDELKRLGLKTPYELDPSTPTTANSAKGLDGDKEAEGANAVNVTDTEVVQEKENVDAKTDNATNAKATDNNMKDAKLGTKEEGKSGNFTQSFRDSMKMVMSFSDTANDIAELQEMELDFVRQVVRAVGPVHGPVVRTALLGDVAARGTGGLLLLALEDRPLMQLLSSSSSSSSNKEGGLPSRRVFLTRFPGDTTASQVANLRQEVTAIIRSAQKGDEALVVLQTGGGTVTGYGLAAAQLLRFKEAGLKLTIAVEQVAASGGYMMCCVADRIVASPFAVLGSIGVISDIPNVYERLKKEGIEFQTVTAGKYKRTLTPTKKVTQADFDKTKEDVEAILVLFRDFVSQNRPQLDIEQVATGETWFGTAALERKLCDEIKTVDDVIMDFMDEGRNVYEVQYAPPITARFLGIFPDPSEEREEGTTGLLAGMIQKGVRWLVEEFVKELRRASFTGEIGLNDPTQRYIAEDDVAQRVKAKKE